MWGKLIPLALGGVVAPVQIILTVLLLHAKAGRKTAVAFVAGVTTVRVLQGVIFGILIDIGDDFTDANEHPNKRMAIGLIVLGVVLLASGVAQVIRHRSNEVVMPKWLHITNTLSPTRAFGIGFGIVATSIKLWIFTLAAIAAIGVEDVSLPVATGVFAVFVVLTESPMLAILGVAYTMRERSAQYLESLTTWLKHYNQIILAAAGFIIGMSFLVRGIHALNNL